MCDCECYKQIEEASWHSSLSLVIDNLFITEFEEVIPEKSNKRPRLWLRNIENTFTTWEHGNAEVNKFMNLLYSRYKPTQFINKKEQNSQLTFLIRKPDVHLRPTVYRKETHSNRYLHKESHHHLT